MQTMVVGFWRRLAIFVLDLFFFMASINLLVLTLRQPAVVHNPQVVPVLFLIWFLFFFVVVLLWGDKPRTLAMHFFSVYMQLPEDLPRWYVILRFNGLWVLLFFTFPLMMFSSYRCTLYDYWSDVLLLRETDE